WRARLCGRERQPCDRLTASSAPIRSLLWQMLEAPTATERVGAAPPLASAPRLLPVAEVHDLLWRRCRAALEGPRLFHEPDHVAQAVHVDARLARDDLAGQLLEVQLVGLASKALLGVRRLGQD